MVKQRPTVVLDLDDTLLDFMQLCKNVAEDSFNIKLRDHNFLKSGTLVDTDLKMPKLFSILRQYCMWALSGKTIDCAKNKIWLDSLIRKGYRIVISTARECWGHKGWVYSLTKQQLIHEKIPHHRLVISNVGYKLKGIRNVKVFIDSNPYNLEPYLGTNIKLLLLDKPWNATYYNPEIVKIYSIGDVIKYLK